jgi:hypothetical protein
LAISQKEEEEVNQSFGVRRVPKIKYVVVTPSFGGNM